MELAGKTGVREREKTVLSWRKRLLELRPKLEPAAAFAMGFILSAGAVGTGSLPLAAGFLAGLHSSMCCLLGAVGAALGYWHFWEAAGIRQIAVTVCVLLAAAFFEGTHLRQKPLFFPLLTSAISAVLGVAFSFQAGSMPLTAFGRYGMEVLLAGGSAWVFEAAAEEKNQWVKGLAASLVILSLSQILLFGALDLGIVAAAFLPGTQTGGNSILTAALCGGAVELSGVTKLPVTVILCVSAFISQKNKKKQMRLLPGILSLGAMALSRTLDFSGAISLFAGGAATLLISPKPLPMPAASPDGIALAQTHLDQAAKAVARLQEMLLAEAVTPALDAEVFDLATEQVCRGCPQWRLCWEEEAKVSYEWLKEAAPRILRQQRATRRDLPEAFWSRCHQPRVFLRGVNLAVDRLRASRGRRARLTETRQALAVQYKFLSGYLQDTARRLDTVPARMAAFTPEIGIHSAGKLGMAVCGDKGAQFAAGDCRYYVLLCDGMGTGLGAAQESENALSILTALLQAGFSPEGALDMLNSFYVLREFGGFSTVDLLELRLDTGRGALYKWGGAPSYVKNRQFARKIGTAGPPPGVGIGGSCQAEVIRLSLQRGETVILMSDGVDGEEVQQKIASFQEDSPKALAKYLVASASGEEDDRTAAAIRLRPIGSFT